jgi:hypothetical protein
MFLSFQPLQSTPTVAVGFVGPLGLGVGVGKITENVSCRTINDGPCAAFVPGYYVPIVFTNLQFLLRRDQSTLLKDTRPRPNSGQ